MTNGSKLFNIITALLLLPSCSSSTYLAPVDTLKQPPAYKITQHTVARGETLYSIAWRYTLNVNNLANINGIAPPYTVYPGQILNLQQNSTSQPSKRNETDQSKVVINRSRSEPNSSASKVGPNKENAELAWRWPVRGPIVSRFKGEMSLNKGIDIGIEKGQPVLAAETGTVVYAGSGLRGYGKLLIIRHNDSFLSAYAHNDKLLADEGETVKAGQKIAETGSSGTNGSKLHFEIRFNGKPVDPLKYLPAR